MGKSSKKSATKVDSAIVVAAPTKPLKKGKREPEADIEKVVSVKKQKVEEKKVEKKVVKKKVETSSDDDSSSESEQPPKVQLPIKNGKVDSDSEDDSSGLEEVAAQKKAPSTGPKNGHVVAAKKKEESSDDSESEDESSSDEEAPAAKKAPVAAAKKKDESSDDSDDETSSDEEAPAAKKVVAAPAKKAPVAAAKKDESSSDDSDSEDTSSDEEVVPAKKPTAAPAKAIAAKKKDESSDESDSDDSDSDDKPSGAPNAVKPKLQAAEEDSSSEEESSDDEKPSKMQGVEKAITVSKKSSNSDESSDDDEEDSSDEEEQPLKTPKKKDTDVKMIEASAVKTPYEKTPKTPATPTEQGNGSKTLFVGNLSFSVEQADVENFFKPAGEVVDVRFATNPDESFRGFGHVEFATAEAAEKALQELNGHDLLGRAVRLDLARERGAYTPQSGGRDTQSFQKGGRSQGTVFVRGFNKYDGEDEIRSSLQDHFGSCGEITRVSIPKDQDGASKGIAYIDFKDSDAFNQALGLDGSNIGENSLSVEEAKPKDNSFSGGRGGGRDFGGRSGGRGGGRDFGGRRGGRGGGGRDFGGRSGGRFGSGGRGGGRFSKPNLAAPGTGKKTKFNDE